MANFKKLAKKYEKEALASLKLLVSKKSVFDASSVAEGAPFGSGVKSALDTVSKLGKDMGFQVDTCKGYATEIVAGKEGPLIGIYAHSDVVPATGKWQSKDPFRAEIVGSGKEAKLVARGSSDDKGPLIASLYAMKLLSDEHLIDGFRVRLVTGGDEERGSSCLEHYFKELHKEPSVLGFTPDADFPLIYAEKGMVRGGRLTKTIDLSPIVAMDGGVVSNAVCDRFLVTLPSDPKLEKALKEANADVETTKAGPLTILAFRGKAAHGSMPELGVNAAGKAFAFLGGYLHNAFLSKLATIIADPHGASFGGYSNSKELGESSFNYGVVSYENRKHELSLSLDYRYGEEAKPMDAIAALEKASDMKVEIAGLVPHLCFDKKSVLVSTLMKSYRRMTHRLFDKPMAIGGGTYAKEAPNCVAYGSAFKGHPGNIHSPDEYIYLENFYAQIGIYADAILSLGKAAK